MKRFFKWLLSLFQSTEEELAEGRGFKDGFWFRKAAEENNPDYMRGYLTGLEEANRG